jgi:CheY-like chemotaxis protein
MAGSKGKVLAVDDSKLFRDMLGQILKERGYEPRVASSGVEALEIAAEESPDVVLVDLTLPDIDGFEVCKHLRSDPCTHGIPILVITSLEESGFEVMAIDAGADDFIVKPVDPLVLDARISMIIRRMRRERLANPLTGLPGNVLIEQEVACRLSRGAIFALNYADLDDFKNYNDRYGYQRGDECLLLAAHVIEFAVRGEGNKEDFVGHVGGDDFVYITTPDKCEAIGKRIISDFDSAIPGLYDDKTRQRGFFVATDRLGHRHKIPVVTISIATVDSEKKEFTSSIEMVDAVTRLKSYAKKLEGSVYVKERRKLDALVDGASSDGAAPKKAARKPARAGVAKAGAPSH